MAVIGMRHLVVATIKTETDNQAIVYNAGKVMGHAVRGNVTINRSDNPLYGDDRVVDNDNGVTGYELDIATTNISDEVEAYALGMEAGENGEYELTDTPAPYCGVGYVKVERSDGVTRYKAIWYHKVQLSRNGDETETKGENIDWKTPSLTGTGMGVNNSSDGKIHFWGYKSFDTPAAAEAWLDNKAGIASGG